MGRLGLTMRDVLVDPYSRLILSRALGARYFLMGGATEVASFDVSTHVIDAELNIQTHGSRVRVQNAAELRFRLPQIANITMLPLAQQVVVVQQQVVVATEGRRCSTRVQKRQLQHFARVIQGSAGRRSASCRSTADVLASRAAFATCREFEAAQIAAARQQQTQLQAQRDRQITLAAATEAARIKARKDSVVNKQLIVQNQISLRSRI